MGKAACGTCHFAPTFGGTVPVEYRESESEVLGVPAFPDTVDATLDEDPGRINSGKIRDELPHFAFSFKTTTVRNVALTAPYMHNGVYDSLEQVLDFYNRGGGAGIGIELEHQTLPDSPLNLTQSEQKDIIAFLESLTDTVGMTDQNVSLPAFGNEWDNRKQTY
jgi:cytochrome c peroxidase